MFKSSNGSCFIIYYHLLTLLNLENNLTEIVKCILIHYNCKDTRILEFFFTPVALS